MARWFFVACVLFNLVLFSDSGKILVVIPTPSFSHQVVFRPLTQELAKRGHEVTVVTTDPAFPKGQAPPNLTEIDLHDMSYRMWKERIMSLERGEKNKHRSLIEAYFKAVGAIFEEQVQTKEFQEVLYGSKYDLLLLEGLLRPSLGLVHVLKSPVILMTSFGGGTFHFDSMGAPTHPVLYPSPSRQRQRLYNLTMWEKATELIIHFYFDYQFTHSSQIEMEEEYMRRIFGKDVPSLGELKNKVDLMFINIHPIFEGNRPVPPGIIHVWGIHKRPQNDLPEDLKTYLDSSKHGVIYMSFGSSIDPTRLPQEKLQMFINVFSKLPYDVLWKWNNDELTGKPDNVRISKWFPQSDLLRHPKIKLFITQGGLQSTDEAIKARVPLVGIPIGGDQWYNVEKYVHLGIGVKLDFDTITEDGIRNAIHNVIDNVSYRRNIEKLDELMRDEPMDGLQRAIWWTEYVLRHSGASHLRAPAANISWAQYLELELVTIVLLCLGLCCFIVLFTVLKTIRILRNYFGSSQRKAKVN